MIKSIFAGAVFSLTLAACASTPPTERNQVDKVLVSTDAGPLHSSEDARVYAAEFKSARGVVVPILRDAYEEMGIAVKVADPVTGQVGNNFFVKHGELGSTPLSRYITCGNTQTGPAADNYKVTLSVVSLVSASGTGSKVNTYVQARADNSAGSSGSVKCESVGTLEAQLHRILLRRLGDREL